MRIFHDAGQELLEVIHRPEPGLVASVEDANGIVHRVYDRSGGFIIDCQCANGETKFVEVKGFSDALRVIADRVEMADVGRPSTERTSGIIYADANYMIEPSTDPEGGFTLCWLEGTQLHCDYPANLVAAIRDVARRLEPPPLNSVAA